MVGILSLTGVYLFTVFLVPGLLPSPLVGALPTQLAVVPVLLVFFPLLPHPLGEFAAVLASSSPFLLFRPLRLFSMCVPPHPGVSGPPSF